LWTPRRCGSFCISKFSFKYFDVFDSRGNYFGKPIFEFGNGCSRDSDCTTYKGSRCNVKNKLCLTNGQTTGKPSRPSKENNNQSGNTRPAPNVPTPPGNRSKMKMQGPPEQLLPARSLLLTRYNQNALSSNVQEVLRNRHFAANFLN
uniref:BPTI/Kunitz inhibitor domain-containing protein n=1 Tax=Ascaris lumbricoides TaxID=6252 RepID=A0A0M3HF51_ASCLU